MKKATYQITEPKSMIRMQLIYILLHFYRVWLIWEYMPGAMTFTQSPL